MIRVECNKDIFYSFVDFLPTKTSGYSMEISEKIQKLKKEKKALILAHNYQRPEIQEIADYVGDSVELSKIAMQHEDSKFIVFSAVDFMAESAAILNPKSKVLLPSLGARCPMAQMLLAKDVKYWKRKYPKIPVVLYVNTLAETKAEGDICCTSANAAEVVKALDSETVLFGPDRNLAWYVQQKTGKNVIPIPPRGFCPTHLLFQEEDMMHLKKKNPSILVLAHPECSPNVQKAADFVGSTSQMCRYVKASDAKEFAIATEIGLLHRLKKENPDKRFVSVYEDAVCPNMKLNTLDRIYLCLKEENYHVTVPKRIAAKARETLNRMFEITINTQ